jgi:hypothetical protein
VFNGFQVWDEPRWLTVALLVRACPGEPSSREGIAGYAAWMPDENDIERWWDDPGIITGAGIALALLAGATS